MSEFISKDQLVAQAKEEYKKIESKIKDGSLAPKDRMAIPQMVMPAQEPQTRARLMTEVCTGYTEEMAVVEANRCLQCKNQPCVSGCPVNVQIPQFIAQIAKGEFKKAVDIIKETSLLPAICGRVCPQEKQCQGQCTVGKTYKSAEKAVSIGRLERFVADWERENNKVTMPTIAEKTGKKVAVIGAGPAGLTVAADCARAGHEVTVFEAFHKAGGVMMYGIPEFRLPKAIVQNEVENLKKMGVNFEQNFLVGRTNTLDQILTERGFDAAFVGTGAGLPKFMNIPGENFIGIFSANEYLTRANLMKGYDKEHADTPIYEAKHVVVCGAGNVAMDAARMALRLGAEKVDIVYRRTRNEMPARIEEIAHAEEEGVNFRFLENPVEVLGNEEGKVRAVKVLSYELGEPDASGRRSPVAIKGSEHEIECDAMIVALGNGSNPLLLKTTPGLNADAKGHITVDEKQATSKAKVWAGGDIVLGAATVILAMGEGRKAAAGINEYLSK
ncbi:MAG: NADPH-dependent glutamate synthase [Treponema sp.]|nr:NADPH-dependent glutamate synthase [Candidatus Treponema merdequi]